MNIQEVALNVNAIVNTQTLATGEIAALQIYVKTVDVTHVGSSYQLTLHLLRRPSDSILTDTVSVSLP
jgi:hypothetical protein